VSHRDRLVQGALDCLQTKGYARTTARDIAATAGANLASITYHFGSKEALLNHALLRVSEQWTEALGAVALSEDTDPLTRIATAFNTARETLINSPAIRRMYTSFLEAVAQAEDSTEFRAQMGAHYTAMRSAVSRIVRSAISPRAEQRGADPDAVASFLLAAYDGLMIQTLVDPASAPEPRRLIASLVIALTETPDADSIGHSRDPQPGVSQ
jgi:AcrR family transcriptional regulator